MQGNRELFLGLDIGSVSLNTAVMNSASEVTEDFYDRLQGNTIEVVLNRLKKLFAIHKESDFAGVALTGIGSKKIANILQAEFINEIICISEAAGQFHPDARTIIDMGGEDAKLIVLGPDPSNIGKMKIMDFSMNSACAAGTGSFLDQQAARMGFSIEQFGQNALKAENVPRIAGRCSVFAKSDMIHLQQIATPDFEIIAGLCYAVARNFKGNIGKGKGFAVPIVFQGGVAANQGMIRAFKEILKIENDADLIIPEHYTSMGAIGSIIVARKENKLNAPQNLIGKLEESKANASAVPTSNAPLKRFPEAYVKAESTFTFPENGEKVKAALGIDVGSLSTNLILLDEKSNLITKRYLPTAGRPIEAVREGFKQINEECGDRVEIIGVGTTGSGRYLTADFIGADIVRNEITAQATAAIAFNDDLDTIFEIGGQDSKYISVDNGAVVDFEMNKACAAGTGSFLEEQAEKLDLSIKKEFADTALKSTNPVPLGDKCTVFMESDLVHHQQAGADKQDLVAGLAYSIVHNYLNKVVGDRRIGNNIFFQGGTAFNQAVLAAFREVTGKDVRVPPHHEVTGAIGMGMLVNKELAKSPRPTRFKGFDLSSREYKLTTFECKECDNLCTIRMVKQEGEKPLFYGSRCEKYDVATQEKQENCIPDLFAEREKLVFGDNPPSFNPEDPKVIGVPRILFIHELFPFFRAYLNGLGFTPVLSDPTNLKTIHTGVEKVVTDMCFPIKVAHGHIMNMIDKGFKRLFIPSIISLPQQNATNKQARACPWIQTIPYTSKSAIDYSAYGVEVLEPSFFLSEEKKIRNIDLINFATFLGASKAQAKKAIEEADRAQNDFLDTIRKRGKEIIAKLKPDDKAMVILSRSYNGCDNAVNLNLPKKFRELGVLPIPVDFLPIDERELAEMSNHVYWKSGKRILNSAAFIKDHPNLYAVYMTNFSCGPDSFVMHYFREEMKGKPYLLLEVDEHSADAGAVTRCEAFLDSLINYKPDRQIENTRKYKRNYVKKIGNRTLYIPYISDVSYSFKSVLESVGIKAAVIPPHDQETVRISKKYVSGKECYPCHLTTAEMIRLLQDNDPDDIAFFMPGSTGPCRYGNYALYQRMILDEAGYKDVPLVSPNQDEGSMFKEFELGGKIMRHFWDGIVAIDTFTKRRLETRPYEKTPGSTDKVYNKYLNLLCATNRERKNVMPVVKAARKEFDSIPLLDIPRKPIIGIVGEIYVRFNDFANEFAIEQIEALGGEAWMSPFSEWVLYLNETALYNFQKTKEYTRWLDQWIEDGIQRHDEHKIMGVFADSLANCPEPRVRHMLENASPYIKRTYEGEAILSMAKAIDYHAKGASGIVSLMPMGCMPSTAVSAMLERFKKDHENIPALSLSFEGQEKSANRTRLEAFMYQVKSYQSQQLALGNKKIPQHPYRSTNQILNLN